MLQIAITLLLSLHLVCVNVAAGGPLVCFWLEWREGRGDELAGRAGRYLAKWSLWLFVVAIVLGLAIGWLLWSPTYKTSIENLGSRVAFGVAEIVFSLLLMLWHVVWWTRRPQCSGRQRALRLLLPLAAGTNLIYHFPFLFVILSQLSEAGGGEFLDSAGFRRQMMQSAVLARTVHFWLASAAVTGVMLIAYSLRFSREPDLADDAKRIATWGGRLALVPTLLQILVGMWVLLQLPESQKGQLMGDDIASAILFGLAILAALLLMHQLSSVALGNTQRAALVRSMWIMLLTILLMTAAMTRSRPPTKAEASNAKHAATASARLTGRLSPAGASDFNTRTF